MKIVPIKASTSVSHQFLHRRQRLKAKSSCVRCWVGSIMPIFVRLPDRDISPQIRTDVWCSQHPRLAGAGLAGVKFTSSRGLAGWRLATQPGRLTLYRMEDRSRVAARTKPGCAFMTASLSVDTSSKPTATRSSEGHRRIPLCVWGVGLRQCCFPRGQDLFGTLMALLAPLLDSICRPLLSE